MQTDTYDRLLEENRKRWKKLNAEYDPLTGEGLDELLREKRVKIEISDYFLPVQYVPEDMMKVELVRKIVKAGSIKAFIEKHRWTEDVPEVEDIAMELTKLRNKYDFCFWAYFCIRIKKKKGGRGRFKLNYPQLLVLALCETLRRMGVPIDIIILKARQWGGSTFCIFYQTWILFKWDHFHSFAIAAHIQTASETILLMLKRAIETYPSWDLGCPVGTKLKLSQVGQSGHAYAVRTMNNDLVLEGMIFIGTAEKPDTLRSKDIAGCHYSEVGIWPDTEEKKAEDLIADIQEGIVDGHLAMEVMESTAKTSDDFFHEQWVNASDNPEDGGFCRIFIAWLCIAHDTRPIKEGELEFAKWLYDHKDEDTRNGRWKDSGKYYWWLWEQGATLEGINWYRYRRLKISFTKMCNEAPTTAAQAFIAAGKLVFDPFDVQAFMDRCTEPLFTGDLVSDARTGAEVIENVQFVPNSHGNLRIWEMPDDSPVENRYAVAVDIGGPNDTSDFSSVRVIDRLMMMPDFGLDGKPNIVAEMHYHTDHDLLAYDAARLAHWYNDALLIIESNTLETKDKERDTGGDGFEYILDILASFYPNLYMRHRKEEDVKDGTTGKYGFHTNISTKPKIIDNMKTCLRDSLWYEPSMQCCEEMAVYIDDHGKMTAPPRKHDDTLMATAILLWVAFKEMDTPQLIAPRRERKKADEVRDRTNLTTF